MKKNTKISLQVFVNTWPFDHPKRRSRWWFPGKWGLVYWKALWTAIRRVDSENLRDRDGDKWDRKRSHLRGDCLMFFWKSNGGKNINICPLTQHVRLPSGTQWIWVFFGNWVRKNVWFKTSLNSWRCYLRHQPISRGFRVSSSQKRWASPTDQTTWVWGLAGPHVCFFLHLFCVP